MAGQNDAMPFLPSDAVTRIKAGLDHPHELGRAPAGHPVHRVLDGLGAVAGGGQPGRGQHRRRPRPGRQHHDVVVPVAAADPAVRPDRHRPDATVPDGHPGRAVGQHRVPEPGRRHVAGPPLAQPGGAVVQPGPAGALQLAPVDDLRRAGQQRLDPGQRAGEPGGVAAQADRRAPRGSRPTAAASGWPAARPGSPRPAGAAPGPPRTPGPRRRRPRWHRRLRREGRPRPARRPTRPSGPAARRAGSRPVRLRRCRRAPGTTGSRPAGRLRRCRGR